MKIQIDTEKKEILVIDDVSIDKLIEFLKSSLKNEEWEKYKIRGSGVHNSLMPIYPTPNYPIQQPFQPYVTTIPPFTSEPKIWYSSKASGPDETHG